MRHFFLFNSFLFLLFLCLILLTHCQQNLPESWPNPSLLGKKCYCQSPFAYFLASRFISALLTNPLFTILASWILSGISSFYPVFSPNLLSVFSQLKQNTDVWQDVNNTLCLRHVDVRTWISSLDLIPGMGFLLSTARGSFQLSSLPQVHVESSDRQGWIRRLWIYPSTRPHTLSFQGWLMKRTVV